MPSERTVRQPVCQGGHIQLKAGTTSKEPVIQRPPVATSWLVWYT
jgi:hypothetical protein